MSGEREAQAPRDAAREALVSSLIVYGVQAAFLLGITAAVGKRYWLDHARWRFEQWRKRGERASAAALAEVRRDISRLEHGDTMPGGGRAEPGLYGGIR